MTNLRMRFQILLFAPLVFLTACFEVPVEVEGLWKGDGKHDGTSYNAQAMIVDDRFLLVIDNGTVVLDGTFSMDDDKLSATAPVYNAAGTRAGVAQVNGKASDDKISFSYKTTQGVSGTMTLRPDILGDNSASLSLLSGHFAQTVDDTTLSVTISPSGNISGNRGSCFYSLGNIKVVDSSINLYKASGILLEGCGAEDGTYTGLGYLSDDLTVLHLAITASHRAFVYDLNRQ